MHLIHCVYRTMARYMILKQDQQRLLSLIAYSSPHSFPADEQQLLQHQPQNAWWSFHEKFVKHLWKKSNHYVHTPLVKLIEEMPDVAETLLAKFVEKTKNGEKYSFKFLEMYIIDKPDTYKKLAEAAILLIPLILDTSDRVAEVLENGIAPRAEHWPPHEERAGLGQVYYNMHCHPLKIMVSYKLYNKAHACVFSHAYVPCTLLTISIPAYICSTIRAYA